MHFTLSSAASAIAVSSLVLSASAGVVQKRAPAIPALFKRQTTGSPQYCTVDDILGPLSSYLPITLDATSFCSTYISIGNVTNIETVTPRSTVYATTTNIATTTDLVTVYGTTATETVTETAAVLKKRAAEALADAAAAAAPAPTPAPDRALVIRRLLETRQDSSLSPDQESMLQVIGTRLESACSCLDIPMLTICETVTAATSTRTEEVIGRLTAYLNNTVTEQGATTTTVTVTSSSSIIGAANLTTMSLGTSSSSVSTTTASLLATSTISSSPSNSSINIGFSFTSSSSAISSSPAPSSNVTSSSTIGGTATTTTPTVVPTSSICPALDGTTISSNNPCTPYTIQCDTDYAVSDSYELGSGFRVGSFDICLEVCDLINGDTATLDCAGIVFDPFALGNDNNCFELKSFNSPIHDSTTLGYVAAVLDTNVCPSSNASSSASVTIVPTGAASSIASSILASISATAVISSNLTSYLPTGTAVPTSSFDVGAIGNTRSHSNSSSYMPTGTGSAIVSGTAVISYSFNTSFYSPTGTGYASVSATAVISSNLTSYMPTGTAVPTSSFDVGAIGNTRSHSNSSSYMPTGTGYASVSATAVISSNLTSYLPTGTGSAIVSGTAFTSYPYNATVGPIGASSTGFPISSAPSTCGSCSTTTTITFTESFYTTITAYETAPSSSPTAYGPVPLKGKGGKSTGEKSKGEKSKSEKGEGEKKFQKNEKSSSKEKAVKHEKLQKLE